MDQEPPSASPAEAPTTLPAYTTPPSESTQQEKLDALYPDDPPKDEPEPKPETKADAPAQDKHEPYSLKAPEGSELDPALLTDATPVLRGAGLSNEQAQQLVPLVTKIQERVVQQQSDAFSMLRADWSRQSQKDPEIGGGRWKETQRQVGVALAAAGVGKGHEFRELMNDSGLGNHPVVLKVFARLGRHVERQGKGGGPGRVRPQHREQILYPED